MTDTRRRLVWGAVAALTLLGLALRLAAARGALWLDEAWSAHYALVARDPIGVFVRVHHDNNHLLNTLWLQWLGPEAPPMAKRALSIACGTATIPVAALFARRDGGAIAAVLAALAFALSPIMVTYGAEARGYAAMILATLAMWSVVERWLERPARLDWLAIASIVLIGTLAQFLMIASLGATLVWAYLVMRGRDGPHRALVATGRLFAAGIVVAGLIVGVIVWSAIRSTTGFEVGDYSPFDAATWLAAVASALAWTIGWPWPAMAAGVAVGVVAGVAVLIVVRRDGRTPLWVMTMIAFPLAFPVMRIGNAQIPRYYLLVAIALLPLLAGVGATALARRGWRGGIALALVAAFVAGSATLDARIIANRRADPAAAIAAMAVRAPDGASVVAANHRMVPVLRFAAIDARYPLRIIDGGCAPARFLLADGNDDSADLAALRYCGRRYRQIARARVEGLSGTWWWLFERIG